MIIVQLAVLLFIVFGVLVFLMWKISAQNTQTAVGRLDAVYQDLLAKQKEVTAKIEEAEKEYQAKKEASLKDTEKMKADAIEEMRTKRDEMLKQAKAQSDEMLERAKASTDEHFRKIETEARVKVVDTAAQILMEALESKGSVAFHNMVVDDFFNRLKDFDLSKISPHIETVTVKTPYPLDDQQKARLNSMISSKINRTLKLEEIYEKQLIAGVLVEFGTLLIEGSIASSVKDAAEKHKEKIRMGTV